MEAAIPPNPQYVGTFTHCRDDSRYCLVLEMAEWVFYSPYKQRELKSQSAINPLSFCNDFGCF